MYCVDSHATDVDHFRPKARFPGLTFKWSSLLLACSECGRFKGDRFPQVGRRPLLVDPTSEDPWRFLDFDPDTGNVVARFDAGANDWSPKGEATVDLLQLDRREALSEGYKATYRRICGVVYLAIVADTSPDKARLVEQVRAADDHGLAGWLFSDRGRLVEPMSTLAQRHPEVWRHCRRRLG